MAAHLSADRNPWARARAVGAWRRLSWAWWRDGLELDLAAVWTTWVDAHDGDQDEALGHLLVILDGVGMLDDKRRRSA